MRLMEIDKYVRANRKMWNQTADVYREEGFDRLAEVGQADFTTFDETERRVFAAIGIEGKDVAQLGCNNARELLSVKKAGAGRCVGFDLSENFLEQGRQLAEASGQPLELVCASVYDIGASYTNGFDVVYVTVGVLGWLPDLPRFFGVVERLLQSGGQLFLYDQHPMLGMFDRDILEIDSSYFRSEPFGNEALPDYMDPAQTGSAESYWFQHTLSSIIGLCLQLGLHVTHFEEHEHDLSTTYRAFQDYEHKPPLSYSLVAEKSSDSAAQVSNVRIRDSK